VVRRIKTSGADSWVLSDGYYDILRTFEGVITQNAYLEDPSLSEDDHLAEQALREYDTLSEEFE